MSLAALIATCAAIHIQPVPFDPPHDYSMSYASMNALLATEGLIGAVAATPYYVPHLDTCTLELGYRNAALFVVKEMREDRCAFDKVLKHEEQHVAIYRAHLAAMPALVRFDMTHEGIIKAFALARLLHAKHDSPEEYRSNVTACRGVIPRLVGDH